MSRLSYLLSLLAFLNYSEGRIPIQDFYPYGTLHGDSALERWDDASTSVLVGFNFPFFGRTYRLLYISTNGILNFGNGSSSYTPRQFPLPDFHCIAAYWTDSDPSRGGNIFYREVNDTALLGAITAQVRSKYVGYQLFDATWALIVTYDSVAQYGCNTSESCSMPCSDTLMYQFVLTSDGVNSFTIFLYNDLPYTSGTADCWAHAQIGFNAGDGKRFYLVPSSNTANINTSALDNSNVGTPGMWMFSVEGSEINEGCNANGRLEIYPRKTLYFGREDIIITGPCFNESSGTITVTFAESIPVVCQIVTLQVLCRAPYFTRTGSVAATFTFRNTVYTTFIMIVDVQDNLVVHAEEISIASNDLDLDAEFDVTWNSTIFGSNDILVFMQGYQVDTILGGDSIPISDSVVPLDYYPVSNNGRARLRPIPNTDSGTSFIRKISLMMHPQGNRLPQMARIITLSTTPICGQHCRGWYGSQPTDNEMTDIFDRVSERSPCAPAVAPDFPEQTENFEIDSSCNPSNPSLCQLYHPGATACYRSTNNVGGEVAQCCYDNGGVLMLGPPGGGTLDFADSKESLLQHFWQDVIPYFTCCICSDNCKLYYDKRPSIDSRFFQPPGWGDGGGDPHFKTIDGTDYTFNPVGEFIYLTTESDIIQVRISQFMDENNNPKQASYISAFVVKGMSSDTIQVELNEIDMFRFRINGEVANLDFGTWSFNGISLNYINRSLAQVHSSSALGVRAYINSGIMNVILSIPQQSKGKVHGLVGNWDDNPENDLQLPDGTWISPDSSQLDIHRIFGMSWTTTSSTSLFTYPTGLTWQDYQNETFLPDYSQPPENSQCNGNAQCNYDTHVTGNVFVGLSNVARQSTAAEQQALQSQLMNYCPRTVTVNNGQVSVTQISETHVIYQVTCNPGVRMDGYPTITCQNGKYEALPTCKSSGTAATALLILATTLFTMIQSHYYK